MWVFCCHTIGSYCQDSSAAAVCQHLQLSRDDVVHLSGTHLHMRLCVEQQAYKASAWQPVAVALVFASLNIGPVWPWNPTRTFLFTDAACVIFIALICASADKQLHAASLKVPEYLRWLILQIICLAGTSIQDTEIIVNEKCPSMTSL